MKTTLIGNIIVESCSDIYTIRQGEDKKFYVNSKNGLHSEKGVSLRAALERVKVFIKNDALESIGQ